MRSDRDKKVFNDKELLELLMKWDGSYILKQNQGAITSIEMKKEYVANGDSNKTKQFAISLTRLYKYLTLEGNNKNEITIVASVRPDSKDDFLAFCESLKEEESKFYATN